MIRFKVSGDGLIPMNLKWWTPTKTQWVPVLLDDQQPFWKRQVDPTYQFPWKSLSPRYAKWKAENYPGEPILRATGLMQDASYIYTVGNKFKVRSTRYGAFHQFGTSRMSARPWMGVPDTSLQHIVPIAWKNILSRKK
jgi:phage gpG-like protein